MRPLDIISWLVAAPCLLAYWVFLVELTLGLIPARRRTRGGQPDRAAHVVILIPAHDEEAGIAETLSRLQSRLGPQSSLLVVADNCSDNTAAIARSLGARVLERSDPARRGKGFALAFGRDVLREAPPDVVIVVDADCDVDEHCFEHLTKAVMTEDAVAVSSNLLRPRLDATPMVQISGFAMLLKNQLRQAGLSRLGVPAMVTGTGVAYPWRIFESAALATDDIVEDLRLGIALVSAKEKVVYVPEARIWSDPSSEAGTLSQRTRWEGGFISTACANALPLIVRGVTKGRASLVWLGLHLLVPPLALLGLLSMVAAIALLLAVSFGASFIPAALFAVSLLLLGTAIFLAWLLHGRDQLSSRALLRVPGYILWKLPVYLGLLWGRKTGWTRSLRDPTP